MKHLQQHTERVNGIPTALAIPSDQALTGSTSFYPSLTTPQRPRLVTSTLQGRVRRRVQNCMRAVRKEWRQSENTRIEWEQWWELDSPQSDTALQYVARKGDFDIPLLRFKEKVLLSPTSNTPPLLVYYYYDDYLICCPPPPPHSPFYCVECVKHRVALDTQLGVFHACSASLHRCLPLARSVRPCSVDGRYSSPSTCLRE